ncbi:MAG: hypothetical protein L0196_00525 [candidate division Zixibacteria bacterium]|nr:hypothetical protein [candidate division Zixibacteria bacterium]
MRKLELSFLILLFSAVGLWGQPVGSVFKNGKAATVDTTVAWKPLADLVLQNGKVVYRKK